MGLTSIQWTDFSWNGWIGCTKISTGCSFCYAETLMDTRYGRVKWGKGQPRVRTSPANWKLPLKWNRDAERKRVSELHSVPAGQPHIFQRPRVFCASLSDWLDDEVPIEWLADLLKLIHDTPNLDWLLLTKRPENFHERVIKVYESNRGMNFSWMLRSWLQAASGEEGALPPANVWLGTSVENQAMADKRIPELLNIPAKVRFLSAEPLLEPIDLHYSLFTGAEAFGVNPGIHWAIFGGESGKDARPCNWHWIESGLKQCRQLGISPFVKQLGSDPFASVESEAGMVGARSYFDLKDKKGGDMAEWPEPLRVREFPSI